MEKYSFKPEEGKHSFQSAKAKIEKIKSSGESLSRPSWKRFLEKAGFLGIALVIAGCESDQSKLESSQGSDQEIEQKASDFNDDTGFEAVSPVRAKKLRQREEKLEKTKAALKEKGVNAKAGDKIAAQSQGGVLIGVQVNDQEVSIGGHLSNEEKSQVEAARDLKEKLNNEPTSEFDRDLAPNQKINPDIKDFL